MNDMHETASFTDMQDSTAEDWQKIGEEFRQSNWRGGV